MSIGAIENRPELLRHALSPRAQQTSDRRLGRRFLTCPSTRMSLQGAWSSSRARQLGCAASAALRSSDDLRLCTQRQSCPSRPAPSRSRCACAPPWPVQVRRSPVRPRAPRTGLELEAAHRHGPSSTSCAVGGAAISSTQDSGGRRTRCPRVWRRQYNPPGLIAARRGHVPRHSETTCHAASWAGRVRLCDTSQATRSLGAARCSTLCAL